MKFNLGITQSSIDISFDYPNLNVATQIPFIWNLNTNKYNLEGRIWNFNYTDLFYLKLVSQYTHKEFIWPGVVNLTNNRYSQATFTIPIGDNDVIWELNTNFWENEDQLWEYTDPGNLQTTQDSGFYNMYFVLEDLNSVAVCIYEQLAYIEIEGRKTIFTPLITNNENREIIYA